MFAAHMPPALAAHLRDMGLLPPPPPAPRAPAPQPLPPVRFDADGEPNF